MIPLLRAGFFRELPHGDRSGPSLREANGRLGHEARDVVSYLRGGGVVATTGQVATDWFDANQKSGPLEVRTDGRWAWPGDLAFYVERYAVELPAEFVAWMLANDWKCRQLSDDELLEVESRLFATDRPSETE